MKKKIYLHIGLGKTATTSIQKILYEHDIQNVYLCKHLYNKQYYQHFNLLNNENEWKSLYMEIKNNNYQNNIITSETIIYSSFNDKDILERFKNYFKEFEIKIIFSIRNLKEIILSSYLQKVKSFDLFLIDNIPYDYLEIEKWIEWQFQDIKSFNYYLLINNFKEVFGIKNIILLKYSSNIVKDFFNIFNYKLIYEKHMNKSIDFYIADNIINELKLKFNKDEYEKKEDVIKFLNKLELKQTNSNYHENKINKLNKLIDNYIKNNLFSYIKCFSDEFNIDINYIIS